MFAISECNVTHDCTRHLCDLSSTIVPPDGGTLTHMNASDTFRANLRKVVDHHRYRVAEAARHWRIPPKTLESVLKGDRCPSIETAEHLAHAAGYNLWTMLTEQFDPANPPELRQLSPREEAFYERLRSLVGEFKES